MITNKDINQARQLTGEVTRDVDVMLDALNHRLPWHFSRPVLLLALGLTSFSLFLIAMPLLSFVWFAFHINWEALALWPITIGLWITSYRLYRRADFLDVNTEAFHSVVAIIFASIFSIATCVHYFSDLLGPSAPAPPPITSCRDHGNVLKPVHYDGAGDRWLPTMCADGATLNDTP